MIIKVIVIVIIMKTITNKETCEPWQGNEWSAEWPTAAAMSRLFEVKITPERTTSESRCSILQWRKKGFRKQAKAQQ
jgi:hypothetical protein